MMWVYTSRMGPGKDPEVFYDVGYWAPSEGRNHGRRFFRDSTHTSRNDARCRIHYLNGGTGNVDQGSTR